MTMVSLSLIGPGRHGTAIAQLFAAHGVEVTLFHYRPQKAERAARAITAAVPVPRSRSPRAWRRRPTPRTSSP